MRVNDVAAALGVSSYWLRAAERDGRIPSATRDRNGHRRYTAEDIEAIRRILYQQPAAAAKEP